MHAQIGHASTSVNWHVMFRMEEHGNQEKVLRHKNHLSVLFYCHVILAKLSTFKLHTPSLNSGQLIFKYVFLKYFTIIIGAIGKTTSVLKLSQDPSAKNIKCQIKTKIKIFSI